MGGVPRAVDPNRELNSPVDARADVVGVALDIASELEELLQ